MFFVRQKVWLPILTRRIFSFLLSFQIITFVLFVLGNIQEFLDSTQMLLLSIQRFSGIFFICFGMYTILSQIIAGIVEKKFYVLRFIATIAGYILGIGMVVIVFFFLTWTSPL
jgi:hypothetical protein